MMTSFAGPLTEFGPDAHGYFNVLDKKNESWPDVVYAIYALPFVSIQYYCFQITFAYIFSLHS